MNDQELITKPVIEADLQDLPVAVYHPNIVTRMVNSPVTVLVIWGINFVLIAIMGVLGVMKIWEHTHAPSYIISELIAVTRID